TPVKPDLRDVCQSAIISSAKLSFQHPELFPTLDIPDQFMSIFTDSPDVATDFFHQVAEAIDGEKEKTLFDCFQPILDSLKASVEEDHSLSRSSGVFQCLDVVLFFAQHNLLAKSEAGPYEFFDQPSQSLKQEHDLTETYIHLTMGLLTERMHQVFYSLLSRKGDSCHRTLCWLGQCLQTNKAITAQVTMDNLKQKREQTKEINILRGLPENAPIKLSMDVRYNSTTAKNSYGAR
ncbi:hypothetical protein LSAT2_001143, partial [Lamellibrachia satsuma]